MSLTNFVSGARWLLCVAGFVVASRHMRAEAPAEGNTALPSPAELSKLAAVIKPTAAASKWQQIPWLTDVSEARRLATKEKRPLFLWTVFGEPLDEC